MPDVLGQALLVCGSAVGAGLLALPAVTWQAGFWPSVAALGGVWAYMAATGVLLVEAAALDPSRANLLGIVSLTLGDGGKRLAFALYLAIYTATLTAYLAEGGRQFVELLGLTLKCAGAGLAAGCAEGAEPPSAGALFAGQLGFALVFGGVILRGPKVVERLNSVCMAGAVLAFCALVYYALTATPAAATAAAGEQGPEPEPSGGLGARSDWSVVPGALPVMVVAFSYHNTVPSVFATLGRKAMDTATALCLGSGIALVMYVVWQAVVLGGPEIEGGEAEGGAPSAAQIFASLRAAAGVALPLFSLLALVTSLLGVGLGCVDFMEDAMQDSPTLGGATARLNAVALTFGPCLVFAVAFPSAFLPALKFSGLFREILFGAIPVLMVWRGRSMKRPGGGGGGSDLEAAEEEGEKDWRTRPALSPSAAAAAAAAPAPAAAATGAGEALKYRVPSTRHRAGAGLLPGGTSGLLLIGAITLALILMELREIALRLGLVPATTQLSPLPVADPGGGFEEPAASFN